MVFCLKVWELLPQKLQWSVLLPMYFVTRVWWFNIFLWLWTKIKLCFAVYSLHSFITGVFFTFVECRFNLLPLINNFKSLCYVFLLFIKINNCLTLDLFTKARFSRYVINENDNVAILIPRQHGMFIIKILSHGGTIQTSSSSKHWPVHSHILSFFGVCIFCRSTVLWFIMCLVPSKKFLVWKKMSLVKSCCLTWKLGYFVDVW